VHRVLPIILSICSAIAAAEPATGNLEQEARELAAQFISELKPRLKLAMQEGGPTRAIEVCASAAPKIADSLSADSGWQVKRVSLKSRNASRAIPDGWEREVLEDFDRRQAAGEAAADLHFGEVSGSRYRYMQAQGAAGLCLTCHGENLAQPVRDTLDKYYPDDQATGYQLGQVRGAISLSRQL
jgi:cytochrome c553